MAHTYIFLLDNEKIMICHAVKDDFEIIPKLGEERFPIDEEFWDWWKEAVSYIDGEKTDFCFIYDKHYDIIENAPESETENSKESYWHIEKIAKFLKRSTKSGSIRLITADKNEIPLKLWADEGSAKVFYTNMTFAQNKPVFAEEKDEEIAGYENIKETAFSIYQRNKLLEDEKNKLI